MNWIMNLLNSLTNNVGSIIGGLQALLKLVKEIATAIVNFLGALTSIFGVNVGTVQGVVDLVRAWCNTIDGWLEKAKAFFLKIAG